MANVREQERAELQKSIWNISNAIRGAVDGWDFKQYVLGMLFYRFVSENITNYRLGMLPKQLQYIAGHSDISTTLNIYTHVNFEDAKSEVERLDASSSEEKFTTDLQQFQGEVYRETPQSAK